MMDIREAGRAVGPLRLIYWSMPLCLVGFLPLYGWALPVLAFGHVLWTLALATSLRKLGVVGAASRFRERMREGWRAACVSLIAAVVLCVAVFLFLAPPVTAEAVYFLPRAASLAAVIHLCVGMQELCTELELPTALAAWKTTFWLAWGFLTPAQFGRFVLVWSALALGPGRRTPLTEVCLWLPTAVAAIAVASVMHSTRNTIRTIMFFKREEEKEEGSGEGQEGSSQ